MVEAEYSQITRQFTVQIRGLGLNKRIYIPMKFDTGAINTVISLKRLICGRAYNLSRINEYVASKENIIKKKFFSASGHQLTGYLSRASNVEISGTMLKNFYYYIVIDGDREISLLGNDFIAACDFGHLKFENVKISCFDELSYTNIFESIGRQDVLMMDELSDCLW